MKVLFVRQWKCVAFFSCVFSLFLPLLLQGPQATSAAWAAPTSNKTLATKSLLMKGSVPSFANLVAKVTPSVVSIRVVEEEEVPASSVFPGFSFPPGGPFEKFFRNLQPNPNGKTVKRKATVQGTGFIISSDGYVVTNNHVVRGAQEISVVFKNNKVEKARLIGRDEKTDLALLKIENKPGQHFPFVALDARDDVQVGDWVLAVGNPFGLGGTVTFGIVSARGRDIGAGPYDDFLQIDASINKGNSGGPDFNMNGEVVGVNTAIYTPSGGSVGIGFAIPASTVSKVVGQLKEHGKVVRGWLGIVIQPVSPSVADSLNLKVSKGALVAQVQKDSPAKRAGFEVGDVVLDINNKPIEDAKILSRFVASFKPGQVVEVTVWRLGKKKILPVVIGAYPENLDTFSTIQTKNGPEKAFTSFGMSMTDGKNGENGGVRIAAVSANSQAAEKDIQIGDEILKFSGVDIKRVDQIPSILSRLQKEKKKYVLILFKRADHQFFVPFSLASKKKDKK